MAHKTDSDFEAENDLRILKEANEIKASKARMNQAKKKAVKEAKANSQIAKGK